MKRKIALLAAALFCFAGSAKAQDTIYYKYPRLRVASRQNCDYYSLMTTNPRSNHTFEIRFNKKGEKIEEQHYYYVNREQVKVGTWKTWFPSGQQESEMQYSNNQLNGYLKTYWPDGQLKRNDTFLKDSCVGGICYDSLGNKVAHFDYHIAPQFPGGTAELFNFLKKHIFFPQTYDPASGKVIVRFLVQKDGRITDIELMNNSGKHNYMGNQVIYAIRRMPNWKPGKTDGVADAEFVLLPVTFMQN